MNWKMTLNIVDKTAMIITITITGSIFYVTHNPLADMFLRVNTKHLDYHSSIFILSFKNRVSWVYSLFQMTQQKDDQRGEDVMT